MAGLRAATLSAEMKPTPTPWPCLSQVLPASQSRSQGNRPGVPGYFHSKARGCTAASLAPRVTTFSSQHTVPSSRPRSPPAQGRGSAPASSCSSATSSGPGCPPWVSEHPVSSAWSPAQGERSEGKGHSPACTPGTVLPPHHSPLSCSSSSFACGFAWASLRTPGGLRSPESLPQSPVPLRGSLPPPLPHPLGLREVKGHGLKPHTEHESFGAPSQAHLPLLPSTRPLSTEDPLQRCKPAGPNTSLLLLLRATSPFAAQLTACVLLQGIRSSCPLLLLPPFPGGPEDVLQWRVLP